MPFNYSRSVILLLLVAVIGFSQASYAGFIIKPLIGISPISTTDIDPATDSARHRLRSRDETFREGNRMPRRHRAQNTDKSQLKSGWAGILALVFACTVYYGPLAVIFGAIGMSKDRKSSGIAKTAFIIGIVETSIEILVIALLIASYGI